MSNIVFNSYYKVSSSFIDEETEAQKGQWQKWNLNPDYLMSNTRMTKIAGLLCTQLCVSNYPTLQGTLIKYSPAAVPLTSARLMVTSTLYVLCTFPGREPDPEGDYDLPY